ncbi:hypothetical protein M569_14891 [Genlisea aurea]|uniref:Uncharacterized protein n=1 Tax=Genlisea aurea TaxID=192259 RepID=S8DB39_9LAMI|nr:hypothetical protein M569_14891 [Genlisea aurea]
MEGLVLRQGRASSRYASGPSPASFSGPVRKWKKQWVLSQPNKAPPLLLFRWTPVTAADSAVEPRKRRFYYAPVST